MKIAWSDGGPPILQILLAAVVLLLLFGPPTLTKLLRSYSAHMDFTSVGKTDLPEAVSGFFRGAGATLAGKGFDAVAHLSKVARFPPNAARRTQRGINILLGLLPGVQGSFDDLAEPLGVIFVAFYIEPEKRDMATATVECLMKRTATGNPPLPTGAVVRSVEFCTEFPGGREINTGNSPAPPLPPLAKKMILRFPRAKDIEALYRIHRAAVTRYGASAKGRVPKPGREGQYLSYSMARDLARYADMGYMFLDQESEAYHIYRLTWRGAFVWTWRSFWPGSMFAKAKAKRETKRILAELGETYPT